MAEAERQSGGGPGGARRGRGSSSTHTEIRAPFAGMLDKRPVEIGDLVESAIRWRRCSSRTRCWSSATSPRSRSDGLRRRHGRAARGWSRASASRAGSATSRARPTRRPAPSGRARGAQPGRTLRRRRQRRAAGSVSSRSPAHRVAGLAARAERCRRARRADGGRAGRRPLPRRQIVRAGAESVWLAGLPERLRLITVGQGFVRAGRRRDAGAGGRAGSSPPRRAAHEGADRSLLRRLARGPAGARADPARRRGSSTATSPRRPIPTSRSRSSTSR